MRIPKVGAMTLCVLLCIGLSSTFGDPIKPKDVAMPKTMMICGGVGAGSTSTLITLWIVKRLNEVYKEIAIRHIPGGNEDGIIKASNGTVAIGKTEVGSAKRAWNGLPPEFAGHPYKNARLITNVPTTTVIAIATLKSRDDIKTAKDLWNKKCGVGMSTSITQELAKVALAAYGITPESIKKSGGLWSYGKWEDQFDMMAAGTLDVVIMGTPQPFSAAMTIDKGIGSKGIKLIPFGEEGIAAVQKTFPENAVKTIPANTYSGQKEPVKGFGTINLFCVNQTMPDEVVYNILYAAFLDEGKGYREIAADFKNLDVLADALIMEPIPWHPGAVQYWRDRKMMK